jgi:hypothetical protein
VIEIMPHLRHRANLFLILTVAAIFLLAAALILLMTRPAWPSDLIPCWKAKALLTYAGNSAEAEKIAQQHGYTKSQIAEVRRRCGL